MEEQQHIIETFSEMAPRYESLMNSELTRFWGFTYENFVGEFLEGLQTNSEDIILDIATGTAFIPSYLIRHRKPFKKIIGLDLTFHMLHNAGRNIPNSDKYERPELICASAHEMPLKPASIDRAICCLATHHMNADLLLTNIFTSLKPGGVAHLADAGGSSKWKNGIIRFFIKSIAFMYFLITENYSRAIAESSAIANIHTTTEWTSIAEAEGFININIQELKSKKFWAPNPITMKFEKPEE
ncbi:class I SAM-dependent methyltransferase [Pelolinea submarina]|uniref:Ubiquinone/menaquinone biosynthesis C-methylase UbiE n=1 Tax=Pelolinea submarina TaxID=913107 RepID=A0A347ZSC4_9CHLR|nr:class I SAM-dependent methyltransferase [Pelolinea submarina]REG11230.1 ubiquinone/menaquinone biosynthesis C-methylase UbiE [Pelolinea submarina]BBB48205.1 demethylmenaquinone methyltransferase /2-methoxy-6-polyprenyl-1,4-benzoquinol methylase [Pelolinea submarina]